MYTAHRGRPAPISIQRRTPWWTRPVFQAAGDNGLQLLGPDSSVDRSLAQGKHRLSSCPA